VISRRSGGLSIGVNLNPDKICNFDCIYCQVDRTVQGLTRFVELPAMLAELEQTLAAAISGSLFDHPKFADVPGRSGAERHRVLRRWRTDQSPELRRGRAASAEVKHRLGLDRSSWS
jgi:hypothetical protein